MTGFKPQFEGDFPSLGYYAIDWMEENLAMPDRPEYEPFVPTDEQAQFLINLLRVDEPTGRSFDYRRAVYSRPKGPIAHTEPVYTPDGWRNHGDLKVGDSVYAADGTVTQVVELGDEVADDCYRVSFSDGTSVVCTGSHRWPVDVVVESDERERRTLTVEQMLEMGLEYSSVLRLHTLPTPALQGRLEVPAPMARAIVNIEPVVTEPARCITVAHPEHQYLVGEGLVPTCNSGKSPFMSAIAILFALADIVPDGYDANGEPVGKPLHLVRTPLIQLAAVSEDQAANMYTPVLEMIRMGPVMENYPGVDPMNQFIGLPGGSGTGRIEPVTASSTSREGNRPGLAILDQVESWTPSNGGTKLAAAIRRNVAKVGGISIETPNAYIPGERSVAEDTAAYYHTLLERDIPPRQEGLLYDHREAPADTDLLDEDSLRAGLRYAYGDSTWVDLERLIAESRDPTVTEEAFRRYYLNQVTAASDSWISRPEWEACRDESLALEPGDKIVLGFDGSRGRARGRSADATALVALRLRDKLLVPIHVWEQPDGAKDWSPDVQDVHDTVRDTFTTYNVVGMYCDPSGWQEHVARWEALYGRRLKIKASAKAPMSIWPRGKGTQISGAIRSFRDALVQGEIKHNGSAILGRHMLNARRRAKSRQGYLLYKEHPESAQKIDAAYASIMAYQAMLDAVGAGQDRAVKRRRGIRIYR